MIEFEGSQIGNIVGTSRHVVRSSNEPWAVVIGPRGGIVKIAPQHPLLWEPRDWTDAGRAVGRLAPHGRWSFRQLDQVEVEIRDRVAIFRPDLVELIVEYDLSMDVGRTRLVIEILGNGPIAKAPSASQVRMVLAQVLAA